MNQKQGRIHGYPSCVRVGRSSAGEGHLGIWAGAVSSKSSRTPKKLIVAKALDGQRYPLPLCEYMRVCDGERGSAPKGPMTHA